jgi:membrane protease YdiL (CAAX protease family)
MSTQRREILAYIALAYAWTWITDAPLLATQRGWWTLQWPAWWQAVAAFGPALAAWCVRRIYRTAELRPARPSFPRFWLAFSAASPFLVLAAAILVVRIAAGRLPDPGVLLTSPGTASVAGLWDLLVIQSVLQATGEEPGWRGFLLPRLRKFCSPFVATVTIFPVWLLWHLPFFLGRPEFGWSQLIGFSTGILAAAFWLGFIWERTRTVSSAVTWHAASNIARGLALALAGAVFPAFAAVTLAGACVLGLLLWRRSFEPPRDLAVM